MIDARPSSSHSNKGRRFPPEVLTPDEVRQLLHAAEDGSWVGTRNRALLTVVYRTGLRCSEALALLPKDINHETGSVSVLHGKGDRHRIVGIDSGALSVLEGWLAVREELGFGAEHSVFCTRHGTAVKGAYVRWLLPRLAAKAGILKRVHAHGLRHTHAFELAMEGVPMPIIQRQLGHRNLSTTDTYLSHIAPATVIETIGAREWRP